METRPLSDFTLEHKQKYFDELYQLSLDILQSNEEDRQIYKDLIFRGIEKLCKPVLPPEPGRLNWSIVEMTGVVVINDYATSRIELEDKNE